MNHRLLLAATGLSAILVPLSSCGGGSGGGSSSQMVLEEATNGFGRLLPYRVMEADASGFPTDTEIEIRSMEDLIANVSINNPILPVKEWPEEAKLPDGAAGNHFLHARFRQKIDIDSVFDPAPSAASAAHLLGTITVVAINPITGTTTQVQGRAFIGGQTYGTTPDPDDPAKQRLEAWVKTGDGKVVAQDIDGDFPGLGFPGSEQDVPFPGATELTDSRSFVFIPDVDGDLSTHETFPTGVQIRMQMTEGIKGSNGKELEDQAVASATVGIDTVTPEVKVSGSEQIPVIIPGNGDFDVDPSTTVTVEFTEPVQIATIGSMPDGSPPSLSASVRLEFGPTTALTQVPFSVMPRSIYDFTSMILSPVYAFPGSGPSFAECGAFNQVSVLVSSGQFRDLSSNSNAGAPATFFTTGEAPGLVNAPVSPDTIYLSRIQGDTAISVIDLNGFGASTGNPEFDPACPIKEDGSNYPNNPNVQLQGSALVPPLSVGSCPFDGGSSGPFTLTRDSSLDDRLVRSPIIESVGDMMLGHSLDNVFNNGDPFGCQSGGGNLCSSTGLKVVTIAAGGATTLAPLSLTNPFPLKTVYGAENLISFAPHPNPPPMVFPPLCVSPAISSQEPTSVDTPVFNVLVPGPNPLGVPEACVPPQNLVAGEQNAFFLGPSLPQTDITLCSQYAYRQQIGHFLYVVDRAASEVVVLNSNRMTVVDRILLPDPTELAMSPDLDFLAVTNQNANSVSFIGIDPTLSNFHQVVKTVGVGKSPTGICWESGNEDIFVCNTGDNSVTVVSAFTLSVRKTLLNQLNGPIDVVTTPRQLTFGLLRGVYYAYILNSDGSVALFESGPDGVSGWGYDTIIGQLPFTFQNPQGIQPDVVNLNSAIWIAHENQLDFDGDPTGLSGGAVTNVFIMAATLGIIYLDPGFFADPNLRDLDFAINASIGQEETGLTGLPSDFAFDNQRNVSALTNFSTAFSAGFPLDINGKSLVKVNGAPTSVNAPRFMFVACPTSTEGPGVVDVIALEGGFQRFDTNPYLPGTQSVQAPGVRLVMDYFRQ
ncbi:MAG: beta-propeller fold lactonase family protein [Planctomycetota bacterium]